VACTVIGIKSTGGEAEIYHSPCFSKQKINKCINFLNVDLLEMYMIPLEADASFVYSSLFVILIVQIMGHVVA
jgi:hypothetical protein